MLTAASRSHNQAAAAAERQQQQQQQEQQQRSSSYNKLLNKNARARTQWKSYAKYSAKKWNTHTDNKGERKKLKRTVFASQAMKESELGLSEASRRSKEKMSVSRTLAFSFSFVVVVYFFAKRFAQSTRCRRKMLYENLTCVCEYLCVTVCVCVCKCVLLLRMRFGDSGTRRQYWQENRKLSSVNVLNQSYNRYKCVCIRVSKFV